MAGAVQDGSSWDRTVRASLRASRLRLKGPPIPDHGPARSIGVVLQYAVCYLTLGVFGPY
jgi:hypothetical protein